MGTWPTMTIPPLVTIHPWSLEAIGTALIGGGALSLTGTATAAWFRANVGIFIPFTLSQRITVLNMFVYNGSSTNSYIDMGVYSYDGNRIFSTGSTAGSTASVIQSISVSTNTFTTIGPGNFYMALCESNSTATQAVFARSWSDVTFAYMYGGVFTCSSCMPLPSSVTMSRPSSGSFIPVFGLSTRSVV